MAIFSKLRDNERSEAIPGVNLFRRKRWNIYPQRNSKNGNFLV